MATVRKFATLLLCLGVLAWGGPVAAISLFSTGPAKSMHVAKAGSHSCGTAQSKANANDHGCCGDDQGCMGGACGCSQACSVAVLARPAPSFVVFTAHSVRGDTAALAPINAFPPPLPPPRA